MPKPRTLTIRIPEPCNESWDEMKPNGCGRFCAHCEKTVIDFTTLADKDVAKIMLSANGNICGRFDVSQVNRAILVEASKAAKPFPYLLSKIAASVLLLQTFATNAFAQKNLTATTEQNANKAVPLKNKQIVIQGSIKDNNTQAPLIGMEISISGVNYKKYSDVNGNFRFVLPDTFLGKEITVRTNYQTSSSKELEGTLIQEENISLPANSDVIEVHLVRYPLQVLDKIEVNYPYPSQERRIIQGGGLAMDPVIARTGPPTVVGIFAWVRRFFKGER